MRIGPKTGLGLAIVAQAFVLLSLPRGAWPQAPYYAGKTITIIRGGGPGGSGEFQSRALMPYLSKYIPGNPTITMEFMNGASGRKAANFFTRPNRTGSRSLPPAP
jgi:tripartite-type tricarboxylate transporter receptor subunit TctC